MAVSKSLQLARALRSMATRIPYEDLARAAKEITACLSNVVTVGDPLLPKHARLDALT